MAGQPHEAPIARGVARVLYAYEIGQLIDLDESERRITSLTERATIKHKRRGAKVLRIPTCSVARQPGLRADSPR